VTISSGICTNLEDSIDKMINKADDMLYKAKNTGRNRVIMDNLE
jgi:PleD family two-component response regulator